MVRSNTFRCITKPHPDWLYIFILPQGEGDFIFILHLFYFIIFSNMEKEKHGKTIEDIVEFIKNHDREFTFGRDSDYEINMRIMGDVISYMGRDWYLEELHQPDSGGSEYLCADYYDNEIKDVICFDTDIYWRQHESIQEVAEYLWNLNERYKDTKQRYHTYYTLEKSFKDILNLFK